MTATSIDNVVLDGKKLTVREVVDVARNGRKAALDAATQVQLQNTRQYIEENWLTPDAPLMYAFNTGVGLLKSVRIDPGSIAQFQTNLIKSHSAGTGEPMPEEVVRAMMLLRVNAFASNYSGVRLQIAERLLAMLNFGITPVIPSKGSVGASGDLAPLAFMSAALTGMSEAMVVFNSQKMRSAKAFELVGLPETFDVQAKDATALINGATASLAYAVLAAFDTRNLLDNATISLALSLEALRAETAAFEDRVMQARPHKGQRRVAASLLRILRGTQRCTESARQIQLSNTSGTGTSAAGKPHDPPIAPRVQDVYSLRCAPQVHGPALEALEYVEGILTVEMNSATDNPLIFPESGDEYSIISGGHFHGQYVAQAMDFLALAVTDLSAICDRRSTRLVDPACNFELPGNLIAVRAGINTGFPTVQSMGTGLVLENMGLCSPASATSLPAKGNTEDHISNSCFAARRTRTIIENASAVVGIEMLLACQAIDLANQDLKNFALGIGTQAAWTEIRRYVPATFGDDRWIHDDIETVRQLVAAGKIVDAVNTICASRLSLSNAPT